ncbi:MAG: DUF2357 domain-containing protein [Acholeplasmataceae bacterium]|jgi:hypothetical protein|nr:DUF2357 domain-containing protein [Acholeplasmataceae bacterium]
MKKTSDLTQLLDRLNQVLYKIEFEEEFPNIFYQAFLSGENEVYQKSISEVKHFHEDWIGTIESFFPSLNKITNNAKSGLRYEQEVTAIEKAKKINSDSVRHLAANTHLIKEVKDGQVIPKKILVTNAEINYAIYENRFIKTLIDRLFSFVNNRYETIKKNVESFEKKHFNLKSKFNIREAEVDLNIDLNIKEELDDEAIKEGNHELLRRVHHLLKQINGLRESTFMVELKRAKPVIAPIMKTSIILKNVDYNNCYILWLYLDKYNILDFDLEVKESNLPIDKQFMKNIHQTVLTTFTSVIGNQKELKDRFEFIDVNQYKKKSIKNVKKNIKDIIKNPDPYEMEKTQINQYYLEQNKAIFKKSLDKHLDESSSYDVALRKALRDTIAITNALYNSYFEFDTDDEDLDDLFFQQLMKEDLEQGLLRAKDKARVARIIRETKEVDYNNAIRLEKRMLKEIDRVDKELIKENKRKIKDEAKKKAIEERIRIERENLAKNQGILTDYLSIVSEQKKVLADEQKAFEEKLKENQRLLKEEEKETIAQEKKKAAQKYQAEMRALRKKQRQEKLKLENQIKEQRRIQRESLKAEKEKTKKESKERIIKAKEKIQKDYEEKLKKAN